MAGFAQRVVTWQRVHGRHDLPWQATRDPYRVWLSEIMLQQTQVATVLPYFERFVAVFPTVESLASADEDQVLGLWSGLGYYARARNLQRAARSIVTAGVFPRSVDALTDLPGVGRSTAAAIAVLAFGARAAILDGNVKRVLSRHFLIGGFPGERKIEAELWTLAESLLPRKHVDTYTQGLMDLGATLCLRARPHCEVCPLVRTCGALRARRVDEYPAPRPTRERPHKSVTVLVILHGRRVLLEKRPPSGVWGGLWSLPEVPAKTRRGVVCRNLLGVEARSAGFLPAIEHGFTHFTLTIRPVLYRVDTISHRAGEPGQMWLDLSVQDGVALPAPVKRILLQTRKMIDSD